VIRARSSLDGSGGAREMPTAVGGGARGGAASAAGSVPAVLKCVFVLRFDTNQGNVLEWTYPENFLGMDGIEFKGIPSGLHAVTADRVFLKQGGYFGVACFNNMATDEEGQRGARMCSVGCLMDTAEGLYTLVDELSEEAGRQNQEAIAAPPVAKGSTYAGNYSRLKALFAAHKGVAPSLPPVLPASPSSFSSMVHFFGADTFLLWKAALLKKRILFFSPVPIEQGCMRVRWIDRMLGLENGDTIAPSSLLYYVNVFDIDRLSTMDSYIACTSEKIFQEKPQLYDLYVDNREISFSSPEVKNSLVTTPVDQSRYALLVSRAVAAACLRCLPALPACAACLPACLPACGRAGLSNVCFPKRISDSGSTCTLRTCFDPSEHRRSRCTLSTRTRSSLWRGFLPTRIRHSSTTLRASVRSTGVRTDKQKESLL
jgi:hypothetical protein